MIPLNSSGRTEPAGTNTWRTSVHIFRDRTAQTYPPDRTLASKNSNLTIARCRSYRLSAELTRSTQAAQLCMHSIVHARYPEKTSMRGRRVSRERPADQCVGLTVSHSVLYPTIAIRLSTPQSAMMFCHSDIERPYSFSIDGKCDAGPCLGHGAGCSVTFKTLSIVTSQCDCA